MHIKYIDNLVVQQIIIHNYRPQFIGHFRVEWKLSSVLLQPFKRGRFQVEYYRDLWFNGQL